MARDSTVFVLGEDVGSLCGSYKANKDLYKKYGENTGIRHLFEK